jgi:hypothetical protein
LLLALLVLSHALQGCVSMQVASKSGKPKLIGFGRAKNIPGKEGHIYQIVAPGLSFRFHRYAPGLALAWHKMQLFYPGPVDGNQPGQPAAIQNQWIGMNFAPNEIMLGFDRSFAIPRPDPEQSVVQRISYSARDPANTLVQRKEANDQTSHGHRVSGLARIERVHEPPDVHRGGQHRVEGAVRSQ